MSKDKDWSGSVTDTNGKRMPLSPDDAKALWQACENAQKERAERLPDAVSCLREMCSAQDRMRELGWRRGTYCPRDGSVFAVCEIGSTGMWKGFWTDDGSKSAIATGYVIAADCVHRPGEVYFKLLDKLSQAEADLMAKCDSDVAEMIDQMGRNMSSLQIGGDA